METAPTDSVTGQQLQGASSGVNGGATRQDLQGTVSESPTDAQSLNTLQPQGTFTVDQAAGEFLPQAQVKSDHTTFAIVLIGFIVLITLIYIFTIKVMKQLSRSRSSKNIMPEVMAAETEVEPIVVEKVGPKKTATKKKTASTKKKSAKPAAKKKAAPKKRNSAGRKKR